VSAVGVTLCGAPDAPSGGEVQFCFPSGQGRFARWRVALADIHPSGDIRDLRAVGPWPGRITYASSAWTLANMNARAGTDLAGWTIAVLKGQGGGSGNLAAVSGTQSPLGDTASWKDPL
jgi:hypothetical protein